MSNLKSKQNYNSMSFSDTFNYDDVKDSLLEFSKWSMCSFEFDKKNSCNECRHTFRIVYLKPKRLGYLCKECLIKEIFGDFSK